MITGPEVTEVLRAPSYDKIWLDIQYVLWDEVIQSADWRSIRTEFTAL